VLALPDRATQNSRIRWQNFFYNKEWESQNTIKSIGILAEGNRKDYH
jgi:hypothetical protein